MFNKQQLKPLNHKKIVNNIDPVVKSPLVKETSKGDSKKSPSVPVKPTMVKKSSGGEKAKPVKL